MSISASFLLEFDDEMKSTRRILERVPAGKATWRPHPKSTTLGRLATHIAELPAYAKNVLTQDEMNFQLPFVATTLVNSADIVALFDRNVTDARVAIAGTRDPAFEQPWTLKMNGQPVFSATRFMAYRKTFMNHLVHHRAQLGVFLRLNEVALPVIYGPTADER